MLSMLSLDGFRKIWADGPGACKAHLESLMTCMESRVGITANVFTDEWMSKALTSGMAPLQSPDAWADACKRVAQIIKFTQFALGFPTESDASATDVVWLLDFKGEELDVETDLRSAVRSKDSWCSVCDEVLRTAKSRVQLLPVLERVKESLQNTGLTTSRMLTLLEEMAQLREGMRKQDCLGPRT